MILCLKLRIDGGEGRHASVRYARPIILPDHRLWSRFGIRCDFPIPYGLFERELFVNLGTSTLKRFPMGGHYMEGEVVADRLLLTY